MKFTSTAIRAVLLLALFGLSQPAFAEGFSLQSADGKFILKLKALFQGDGRFFLDDRNSPKLHTFVLRSIRPTFEGTLAKHFDFRITPDFGGGATTLQDAYVDGKIRREIAIRVGKFKEPFGLERLQSEANVTFIERALPNNLVPNRDIGVAVQGEFGKGLVGYSLGIFNGVADGASADTDINNEKDFVGRLFAKPFINSNSQALKGLGLGVAGTYGSPEGTATTPALPTYRTTGQQTFFSYRTDGTAAGTSVANGGRYRLSPQAHYYYGPVGVLGEYVLSTQAVNRNGTTANLNNHAWQVTSSYVLGAKASYDGIKPRKELSLKNRSFGALEFAGRYSELNIDDNAFPTFANPARSVSNAKSAAVGLNWYPNSNVKVALNFEETFFKGGAAGNSNRSTEKLILTRLQLGF